MNDRDILADLARLQRIVGEGRLPEWERRRLAETAAALSNRLEAALDDFQQRSIIRR